MIPYISFKNIHDKILLKYLALADSVYDLLHPDQERAHRIFAEYVEDSVRDFYAHYPMVLRKDFKGGLSAAEYTFHDNFDGYIAGNIPEDQVELVPEAIAKIITGIYNKLTKNNWRYEKPTLTLLGGATRIYYYAIPPVRWKLSPDGDFTEDSRVYGIDPKDEEIFCELVALNILNYLQLTRASVSQPTGLNFFDYREIIAKLQQDVDTFFAVSAAPYVMW